MLNAKQLKLHQRVIMYDEDDVIFGTVTAITEYGYEIRWDDGVIGTYDFNYKHYFPVTAL